MNISNPVPGPRRKRHWLRWTLFIAAAFTITFVIAGAIAASLGTPGKTQAKAAVSTTPATPAAPAAAVTTVPVPPKVRVHFIVTGTGVPSITYGSDSDNRSPAGGVGVLGDGVALPFRASMAYRPDAQYYSIDAQLEGNGNITCKIVVTAGPAYAPLTVGSGHAQGADNICSAQAAPSGTGSNGLPAWQNEG